MDILRDTLPHRHDGDGVWCDRCQRAHRPFSREDYDKIISDAAKSLANRVDEMAAAEVFKSVCDGTLGRDEHSR